MKPMLCRPEIYDNLECYRENWIAEEKFDGVRAYIENGQLHNRRGDIISHKFPEIDLKEVPKDIILDGELICEDFKATAGRVRTKDKLKIRILSRKNPATFMAFDMPSERGTLLDRREALTKYEGKWGWLKLAEWHTDAEKLYQKVVEKEGEGIVLKNTRSTYQEGKRSPDWLKVKLWLEAVATFTKYREHPKGVRLETDTGRSVNVNGAQAESVKNAIDKDGQVTCEVQYLPQLNSDAWRFPSFKRVLGDA